MESQGQNKLTKKFWQGDTSREEEQTLFASQQADQPSDLQAYSQFLEVSRQRQIPDPDFDQKMLQLIENRKSGKRRKMMQGWWKVAASILLVIGLSFGVSQLDESTTHTEYVKPVKGTANLHDTNLAFMEVKKALFILSANMNKGLAHTTVLKEFHNTKKKLKP